MKILLHICCSNCSIAPYKLLKAEGHAFTGFWFNPNIHPAEEYQARLGSLKRLAHEWSFDVQYAEDYTPEEYFKMFDLTDKFMMDTRDLTEGKTPPFPGRCASCYRLRLGKTAEHARKHGFDAFSTTLLISPYQDFEQIVSTGEKLADTHGVRFHAKDYRPHFRDAMTTAKELGLYRQKYCGCIFSKREKTGVSRQESGDSRQG